MHQQKAKHIKRAGLTPEEVQDLMKKSKMDWEAHRKKDNLEEELNNVKNSKKSIVDKNDFLLRTDHRTFELEREERLKRINNRKNN